MKNAIISTTAQQVAHTPCCSTAAVQEYLSKVNRTSQATYDRWPEASGMRCELWSLAQTAGIAIEQFRYDLDNACIDSDGGRW